HDDSAVIPANADVFVRDAEPLLRPVGACATGVIRVVGYTPETIPQFIGSGRAKRRARRAFENAVGSSAGEQSHDGRSGAADVRGRVRGEFARGVRNVETAFSARNRERLRKLLSFMLIAHVE